MSIIRYNVKVIHTTHIQLMYSSQRYIWLYQKGLFYENEMRNSFLSGQSISWIIYYHFFMFCLKKVLTKLDLSFLFSLIAIVHVSDWSMSLFPFTTSFLYPFLRKYCLLFIAKKKHLGDESNDFFFPFFVFIYVCCIFYTIIFCTQKQMSLCVSILYTHKHISWRNALCFDINK